VLRGERTLFLGLVDEAEDHFAAADGQATGIEARILTHARNERADPRFDRQRDAQQSCNVAYEKTKRGSAAASGDNS